MADISKKSVGELGEKTAIKFLKKNKYKIRVKNFISKYGEIDIICENKEYIVFVEVKTRKVNTIISGVYAVNTAKQNHIFKTATVYMNTYHIDKQPRFDIIEVEYDENGKACVKEHFINAFEQGGAYAVF